MTSSPFSLWIKPMQGSTSLIRVGYSFFNLESFQLFKFEGGRHRLHVFQESIQLQY